MLQRFLTLGPVPELRPDPIQTDKSAGEIETYIPIDVHWEIEEIVKDIRYARIKGESTEKLWRKFSRLIYPCIVSDKDRYYYKKYAPS